MQSGAAESDIPGHRPAGPTVTLAQALQAGEPESHRRAPSPSQTHGGWSGGQCMVQPGALPSLENLVLMLQVQIHTLASLLEL